MAHLKKGIDKRKDNKEEGLDHQHSGYPTLFTKVEASFPKILLIRYYQGVGKMMF